MSDAGVAWRLILGHTGGKEHPIAQFAISVR